MSTGIHVRERRGAGALTNGAATGIATVSGAALAPCGLAGAGWGWPKVDVGAGDDTGEDTGGWSTHDGLGVDAMVGAIAGVGADTPWPVPLPLVSANGIALTGAEATFGCSEAPHAPQKRAASSL
ncbi:MAG TPA: hypothetical protein VGO03_08745 [Acidimicrobiia bacterium]|jgi:hypothetical protein